MEHPTAKIKMKLKTAHQILNRQYNTKFGDHDTSQHFAFIRCNIRTAQVKINVKGGLHEIFCAFFLH